MYPAANAPLQGHRRIRKPKDTKAKAVWKSWTTAFLGGTQINRRISAGKHAGKGCVLFNLHPIPVERTNLVDFNFLQVVWFVPRIFCYILNSEW